MFIRWQITMFIHFPYYNCHVLSARPGPLTSGGAESAPAAVFNQGGHV
jgi:hypothetical protein